MELFKSIMGGDEDKKGKVTLIYEDKDTQVKWYEDTPFSDTKFAIQCACDAMCDSEFEVLDYQAQIIDIENLKEIKDGSIFFLRKKQNDKKQSIVSNILLDGKRKLLVQIEPLRHLESQVAIKYMVVGSNLLKHTRNGFPHIRLFQVSQDLRRILWYTKTKPLTDSQVSFDTIKEISIGQNSDNFNRYPLPMLADLSFSIYYINKQGEEDTLDITCKDNREFDLWMIGLKSLFTHFNSKIICKDELLNHSKSYQEQVSSGNISNCSKYLMYEKENKKETKTLEKFIITRNLNIKDMCNLILRLVNKIITYKDDIFELTDLVKDEENMGKDFGYQELFADEAIADDTETQKTKMINLMEECELTLGIVIHELLWYSREHRLTSKFYIDEDEYDDFSKKLFDLEIQGNTFTNGKDAEFDSDKINLEFFLKELDIKLWKLEIDVENVGDIINRFKYPQEKGFFDKLKELFN